MATLYTVKQEQTCLDEVIWHHYGTSVGTNEAVYNANPGLASYGLFLPVGLQIILPDKLKSPTQQIVRLWD